MANPNEISVDLRLRLDKLKQDAQNAGKVMKELPNAGSQGGKGQTYTDAQGNQRTRALNPTSIMQEDLKRKIEARKKALAIEAAYDAQDLKQQIESAARRNKASELWRKRAEGRESRVNQVKKNAAEDVAKFNRNIGFGALPVMNPTSAIGNFAAMRQSYKAFSTTQTGAGMQAKMGLPAGAGGAIAAAGIVTGAAIALGLALKGLTKLVEITSASFDHARMLYAKQLQSGGMGQKFVIQRSILAEVIGVGENEVMQYGNAIAFLNQKIANSTEIFAKTNNVLTATSWNIKAAEISFQALGASIAAIFAPAITEFANLSRLITDFAANSAILKAPLYALEGILMTIEFAVKLVSAAFASLIAIFDTLIAAVEWGVQKINNMLAKFHVGGFKQDDSDPFANAKKEWKEIAEMLKGTGGQNVAPGVAVSANRMPASTWEKMGMVIGRTGANSDHAKKTASNTTKMVQQLDKIIQAVMPRTGQGGGLGGLEVPMGAQP